MRFSIFDCGVLLLCSALLIGCHCGTSTPGQSAASPRMRTSHELPILYQRVGGFAGTDDRVVIWPDGLVDVTGKLMGEGTTRLSQDRFNHLVALFAGWEKLKDQYLASNVADGYTITISYGEKSIEANDLSPELPQQFRTVFTEIESIAALAQPPAPAAPAPPSP